MKDKVITCVQCENPFVFAVAEQARFHERGFDIPKRCPECRKKKFRAIEITERLQHKGNKKQGWRRDSENDRA
ncbi:MAG: zinc-ribbon domain containing protein [Deltaproteobacteria bacterium]|nr:MAG: zinc-ribbon domain containing protein [Deltaproteobacteria bacterium]